MLETCGALRSVLSPVTLGFRVKGNLGAVWRVGLLAGGFGTGSRVGGSRFGHSRLITVLHLS